MALQPVELRADSQPFIQTMKDGDFDRETSRGTVEYRIQDCQIQKSVTQYLGCPRENTVIRHHRFSDFVFLDEIDEIETQILKQRLFLRFKVEFDRPGRAWRFRDRMLNGSEGATQRYILAKDEAFERANT